MRTTVTFLLALLLLGAASAPADDYPLSPWAEFCDTCGFENLTEDELFCVESLLSGMPVVDNTALGAVQYFLEDGWDFVALHAAIDPDPDSILDDVLQLAVVDGERVLVEARSSLRILPPGYYLGEKIGSTLTLLAPDGDEVGYWIERSF